MNAENAVAEAFARRDASWAALFVLDGVCLVNDHYGYSMGDQALESFSQALLTHLPLASRLYRWSATSFLALAATPYDEQTLSGELERAVRLARESGPPLTLHLMRVYCGVRVEILPLGMFASLGSLLRELDFVVAENLESGRV